MNVIIVAAGMGRRLAPLTNNCPKCLIEIGGRKIIDFTLDVLDKSGLRNITLVVGHEHEKIRDYLGNRVKYVKNLVYANTNSMYSLACAQDYFGEEFIYLHSDIIFDKSILEQILSCGHEICLCVDEKKLDQEDMKVKIENDLITAINKSIPLGKAAGEFIGIAKFKGQGITDLKEALTILIKDTRNRDAYFEYAIEYLIQSQGVRVYPCISDNRYYAEIDDEHDLARVGNDLKNRRIL